MLIVSIFFVSHSVLKSLHLLDIKTKDCRVNDLNSIHVGLCSVITEN